MKRSKFGSNQPELAESPMSKGNHEESRDRDGDIFGGPAIKKAKLRSHGNHMLRYKISKENFSVENMDIRGNSIRILGSNFVLYQTDFLNFVEENKLSLEKLKNDDDKYVPKSLDEVKVDEGSEGVEEQREDGEEEFGEVEEKLEEEKVVGVFEELKLKEINAKLFAEFFDDLSCSYFSQDPLLNHLFLCSDEGGMCEIDLDVRIYCPIYSKNSNYFNFQRLIPK